MCYTKIKLKGEKNMLSLLNVIDGTLRTFFSQFTEALGFDGYLGLVLGVEAFFILLFVIKSAFSYEARLKRVIDKCNKWLFKNKKIDTNNIKEFNSIIKKGPKRLVYYWQQYILYREGGPSAYLSEENIIDKPLKTSSWLSNIKNLGMLTVVWSIFAFIFGASSQSAVVFDINAIVIALVLPCLSALLGVVAIIILKARRVMNLDDIYHIYHLFSRFLTNATVDLTPYLDFNLLFTQKEIENGNPQLREYYEARARKIKEEFEEAQKNDVPLQTYEFENVGVDGSLLLNRAMRESEVYINKKIATLSQIAQIESQKEALKRNYEDVQMSLQRQIQASKENIQKLIEQQAATTNRIEAGLLKNQQQKEVNKNAQLQKDYEKEEERYLRSKGELDEELEKLKAVLDQGVTEVQKAMSNEYQTFFEKVMKSAFQVAEQRVKEEKLNLVNERDKNEEELISVQTQIKRLKDENDTLRDRLAKYDENYQQQTSEDEQGHYDENGNYIYSDGSYHDTNGLFHDVDGKVYNMNGELVSYDLSPEEQLAQDKEELKNQQVDSFGAYVNDQDEVESIAQKEDTEPNKDEVDSAIEEIAEVMGEEKPQTESEENVVNDEKVEKPQEENNSDDLSDSTDGATTDAIISGDVPNSETVSEILAEEEANANKDIDSEEKTTDNNQTENETNGEVLGVVDDSIMEQPASEEAPKRKRGRPRKEKVEQASEEQPKRKRGRPRKTEAKEPEVTSAPKKRGRPPKAKTEKTESSSKNSSTKKTPKTTITKQDEGDTAKKRGRPKKIDTQESEVKQQPKKRGRPKKVAEDAKPAQTQAKKRGRPKKAVDEKENTQTKPQAKKRGRPRKDTPATMDSSFVNQLNELISQQENKLKNLKAFLNSEIDQVLEPDEQENVNHEQDDIMNAVESLKAQADKAKSSGQSEELAKINKRIEDLIADLSNISATDDDADAQ